MVVTTGIPNPVFQGQAGVRVRVVCSVAAPVPVRRHGGGVLRAVAAWQSTIRQTGSLRYGGSIKVHRLGKVLKTVLAIGGDFRSIFVPDKSERSSVW